jgi:hypothetical protein
MPPGQKQLFRAECSFFSKLFATAFLLMDMENERYSQWIMSSFLQLDEP